jgi:carbon-monoxide dehydrogenase medium subunit
MRARGAERALEGRVVTDDVARRAGQLAAGECQPISDVRASARYRRLLVETLVPRAIGRCLARIAREPA